MRNQDKEATFREVLANVSLLDTAAAIKLICVAFGVQAILLLIVLLFVEGIYFVIGRETAEWNISTAVYLFLIIWIIVATYTSDQSYHDHRFAWYFPKLGWIGSIPVALYMLVTVQLFRSIDMSADWETRAIPSVFLLLWMLPFLLFMTILAKGHANLMAKRDAAKETDKVENS